MVKTLCRSPKNNDAYAYLVHCSARFFPLFLIASVLKIPGSLPTRRFIFNLVGKRRETSFLKIRSTELQYPFSSSNTIFPFDSQDSKEQMGIFLTIQLYRSYYMEKHLGNFFHPIPVTVRPRCSSIRFEPKGIRDRRSLLRMTEEKLNDDSKTTLFVRCTLASEREIGNARPMKDGRTSP